MQHLCLRSQASSSSRSFCRLMTCSSSWSLTMAGLERSFCQVALVFLESTKHHGLNPRCGQMLGFIW